MAIKTPQYKISPAGGEYRIALASGAVAAGLAAAAPVFSLRWASTALVLVVKRFNVFWTITTAYTTAQDIAFGLYFARGYTLVDSGGTAVTLTTNNAKLDTRYLTTSMTDMRIATTGTLTAGTRTLDAQALAIKSGGSNTLGMGANSLQPIDFGIQKATNPIIVRASEGLVLNNLVLLGAVGVITVYVEIEWAEVPSNLI